MRPSSGTRPRSTLSPTFESIAGSMVSDPSTATATAAMEPVANDGVLGRADPLLTLLLVAPDVELDEGRVL